MAAPARTPPRPRRRSSLTAAPTRPAIARRDRLIPLGLGLLSFLLAFGQRPGRGFDDTRIELTVDAVRFLERVGAVWSPTTDLGHAQSGQFVGYLFPMGPW